LSQKVKVHFGLLCVRSQDFDAIFAGINHSGKRVKTLGCYFKILFRLFSFLLLIIHYWMLTTAKSSVNG